MKRFLSSPLPFLATLAIFTATAGGAFFSAYLANRPLSSEGSSDLGAERYTAVTTYFGIEPGDVVLVERQSGLPRTDGAPVHSFLTEGGAGMAWLEGGPEPKWKYIQDPQRATRWVRPEIPADAPGGTSLNGDLRTAIDVVNYIERNGASNAVWAYEVSRFSEGHRGVWVEHAADGGLLRFATGLGFVSYAAAAAFLASLLSWVFLGRISHERHGAAELPDLVALAQSAKVLVQRLWHGSWLMGLLLALGGFAVLVTLNDTGQGFPIQPWRSWNNTLVFPGTLVWLGSLVAWGMQHRDIGRLRRAWKGLGVPEV